MNHNIDLFDTYTPIYGFDVSVTDEVGILLDTSTVSVKYDCFIKCTSMNSVCKMALLKSKQCKLYSQVKYSVQLSPSSESCLFQKYIPDYSAINAYLTNWWPFNNNVNDIVGSANLYGGSTTGKSFATDRLNQPASAIYLNAAYYQLPAGKYFAGDFTLSVWVKIVSFRSTTDRLISV